MLSIALVIILAVIYSSQAMYLFPPPATHTTPSPPTMHTTPSPSYHAHHSLPLLSCTPLLPLPAMHTTPSPSYHTHHSLPLLPHTPLSPPPTMHTTPSPLLPCTILPPLLPCTPLPPPSYHAHHSLPPLAMHNTPSPSCHAQIYTASVPAGTDEEMNGTLDKDETVHYNFPIPVIGITVKVCISAGHILWAKMWTASVEASKEWINNHVF